MYRYPDGSMNVQLKPFKGVGVNALLARPDLRIRLGILRVRWDKFDDELFEEDTRTEGRIGDEWVITRTKKNRWTVPAYAKERFRAIRTGIMKTYLDLEPYYKALNDTGGAFQDLAHPFIPAFESWRQAVRSRVPAIRNEIRTIATGSGTAAYKLIAIKEYDPNLPEPPELLE